jgi:hypothetical protein
MTHMPRFKDTHISHLSMTHLDPFIHVSVILSSTLFFICIPCIISHTCPFLYIEMCFHHCSSKQKWLRISHLNKGIVKLNFWNWIVLAFPFEKYDFPFPLYSSKLVESSVFCNTFFVALLKVGMCVSFASSSCNQFDPNASPWKALVLFYNLTFDRCVVRNVCF